MEVVLITFLGLQRVATDELLLRRISVSGSSTLETVSLSLYVPMSRRVLGSLVRPES